MTDEEINQEILVKIGASFVTELQTNSALRVVVMNSKELNDRMKSMGVDVEGLGEKEN